jgi:hypothetical protein
MDDVNLCMRTLHVNRISSIWMGRLASISFEIGQTSIAIPRSLHICMSSGCFASENLEEHLTDPQQRSKTVSLPVAYSLCSKQ